MLLGSTTSQITIYPFLNNQYYIYPHFLWSLEDEWPRRMAMVDGSCFLLNTLQKWCSSATKPKNVQPNWNHCVQLQLQGLGYLREQGVVPSCVHWRDRIFVSRHFVRHDFFLYGVEYGAWMRGTSFSHRVSEGWPLLVFRCCTFAKVPKKPKR